MAEETGAFQRYTAARERLADINKQIQTVDTEMKGAVQELQDLQDSVEVDETDRKSVGKIEVIVGSGRGIAQDLEGDAVYVTVDLEPEDAVEDASTHAESSRQAWSSSEAPTWNDTITFPPILSREAFARISVMKEGDEDPLKETIVLITGLMEKKSYEEWLTFDEFVFEDEEEEHSTEKKEQPRVEVIEENAEENSEEEKKEEAESQESVNASEGESTSVDEKEKTEEAPKESKAPAIHVTVKFSLSRSEELAHKVLSLSKQKTLLESDARQSQLEINKAGAALERQENASRSASSSSTPPSGSSTNRQTAVTTRRPVQLSRRDGPSSAGRLAAGKGVARDRSVDRNQPSRWEKLQGAAVAIVNSPILGLVKNIAIFVGGVVVFNMVDESTLG